MGCFFFFSLKPSFLLPRGLRRGCGRVGGGALCEVLEGLADPHAGPVEGPSQGDENQEQQHGPRGVDPLVGLSLRPRSCLNATEEVFRKSDAFMGIISTLRARYGDCNEPAQVQSGYMQASRELELQLGLKMFYAFIM